MKAKNIRHFINAANDQILKYDEHFETKAILDTHVISALKEVEELEKKAMTHDAIELVSKTDDAWVEVDHMRNIYVVDDRNYKGIAHDLIDWYRNEVENER